MPPLDSRSVTALVHAARAGDERAWDALVRRFTPAIRGAAKRYRLDPHEVDDVVQACWLALFLSLRALREPEALGGWLVTAARRQALRMRQLEVRERLTDEPLPMDAATDESPEDAAIEAERRRELRAAVRELPGRQRAVLELIVTRPHRSYAEMSEDLRMPVGAIGPTRERGLRRLRGNARLAAAVGA
jgi:RNA polymerase sigma factor (sigma-70 family)